MILHLKFLLDSLAEQAGLSLIWFSCDKARSMILIVMYRPIRLDKCLQR